MIRNIEIKNLRGFRHFRLEGLTDLTILTGPNSCGKSTVLDALFMGSSANCAEAVGLTVQRHPNSKDGAVWLFNDPKQPIEIRIEREVAPQPRARRLEYSESIGPNGKGLADQLAARNGLKPFRQVIATRIGDIEGVLGNTVFDVHGEFEAQGRSTNEGDATLIDPANFKELANSYSRLFQHQGLTGKSRLLRLLKPLLPDVGSIEVLAGSDNKPFLSLAWPEKAVALSFVGDGIAALLQIAIEASLASPGSLVLIEEPEVFLHPRAISEVAGLLLELMREGRQVILTTHSLELIDSLLGRRQDEDIDRISLFNLRPSEGATQIVAWPGKQLDLVRNQIGDDLR